MSGLKRSFGFPLAVTTATDVGRVRSNNEDSCGSQWLEDGSLWVMVADGMGGHEAGEVASGLAVQVVEENMTRDPEGDPRERLFNALIEANSVILDEGNRSGTRGMGTTAITALLRGSEVYIALVGDSRLYHVSKGHIAWRTSDHTRVQMLVDAGEIDEETAKNHPEAGMLTRALGHSRMADGRPLEPEVLTEPLTIGEGDSLVLCSDGLTDLVDDWEIGRIIAGRTGDDAAKELIRLAKERGGHDNITVAIVTAGLRGAEYDEHFQPAGYVGSGAYGASTVDDTPTYDPAGEVDIIGPSGGDPSAPPANPIFATAPMAAASSASYGAPMPGPPPGVFQLPPEQAPQGKNTLLIVVVVLLVLTLLALLGSVVLGLGLFFLA